MTESCKRKSRYFETYIQKVLKQVSPNSTLSSDARQQLNHFICVLCKSIAQISTELTTYSKKKTISDQEVYNALTFVLTDEILTNCISEGDRAVSMFNDESEVPLQEEKRNISRHKKASIIFPPFITEKFLRNFGKSNLCIRATAPVFLAASLEYVTADILSSASITCMEDRRIKITVRDIELTFRNDSELTNILKKTKFTFLGGGVEYCIYPLLVKNRTKPSKVLDSKGIKRYRRGHLALKQIKTEQKNDSLILTKTGFQVNVRKIFEAISEEKLKISSDVFVIFQHFIEQYVVSLLHDANYLAIHSNRTKVNATDVALVSYMKGETRNPYLIKNTINDTEYMDDITHHGEFVFEINS